MRLVFLPRAGETGAAFWRIEGGEVVARGAIGADDPQTDEKSVVAVPGEEATCRWLDLPSGRDTQAAVAAGFLLEEELATPRHDLHVAVGPAAASGRRLAVFVNDERMRAWTETAAQLGLSTAPICPIPLLIADPGGDDAIAVRVGEVAVVRGRELALSCDWELLPVLLADRPVREVKDFRDAERLIAGRADSPPVDLRQGPFAPDAGVRRRRGRLAPILGGLLAASLVVVPAADAARRTIAARQATAQAERLAGPAPKGIDATPVERLRARLAALRAESAFPAVAASVFAAVEGVEGMEMQSLLYGEDGAVRATVRHPNYSDIEIVRRQLARSRLSVRETSAVQDGGQILSELVVGPAA